MNIQIEPDSFWHQDMERLPPGDEGSTVVEVRLGGKSAAREIVETIVLTVLIFLAVRGLVQNYRVEGESMLPTLINEQMILVDRISYFRWNDHFVFGAGPQRGDIVVIHAWHEDKDYIKRVVGLPGDRVRVESYKGVYVNDKLLTEPYIKEVPNYDMAELPIPAGSYFVLGDNRRNSFDSHVLSNGPVTIDNIVGRAWVSYWPFNTIGTLPHATYDLPANPAPAP